MPKEMKANRYVNQTDEGVFYSESGIKQVVSGFIFRINSDSL